MATINELQDEVVEEFQDFTDWMDKYQMLIDLGNELAPLDEKYKNEQNLIDGCQSRVWLQCDYKDGKLVFTADSDALIVKGIIALLIRVLSGHTPSEIMDADLYFVEKIGLKDHLSPTRSNGLLAMIKQIRMYALAYKTKEAEKLPLIVVLDDVRSLYNVGSVFRSCDAFRVEAVYLCGITATPPNAEIHKTALGGEDSVDWEYFKTTEEAVEKLKEKGYFVYSIEQVEGSTKLQNLPDAHNTSHSTGYAVIFGNEVKGVKQDVVDMSDGCLEIPQFGTKHSLNVSVTAGIVVWEFAKLLKL